MDPATGDVVLVYGCSKTATGLVKTDTGTGSYTGVWTNPQDFATDTLTLGSYVTIEGIVDYFSSSKTVELEGVITTEVKPTDAAYTYKYAASAAAATNGTVSLSKEADLSFGEAVTITATPASGYKVDTVVVDRGYGKEYATAGTDGTYSFKANVKNVVTVAFVSATAVKSDYTIDAATASGLPTAYAPGKTVATGAGTAATIDGLPLVFFNAACYSAGIIQFAGKASDYPSGLGYIANTAATERPIASIAITFTASKYSSNVPSSFSVLSGSAALTSVTSDDIAPVKESDGSYTITYTPVSTTDTFFIFGKTKTNTYAQYVSKIVVTMIAA